MQVLAKAEPNCLYFWDPDIVSCFSGDNHIRRVHPNLCFVINKCSMHCLGLPDHRRCSNYNGKTFTILNIKNFVTKVIHQEDQFMSQGSQLL